MRVERSGEAEGQILEYIRKKPLVVIVSQEAPLYLQAATFVLALPANLVIHHDSHHLCIKAFDCSLSKLLSTTE